MKMTKRIIYMLLCLSLVAAWPLAALAEENQGKLHIRNLEDFLTFAENCVLDSYSRGKTVYLDCDLDLSGTDFAGIPTFGGTFEGQGHEISGLSLTGKSAAVGLFRYIQTSGIVRNLTVSGQVAPGGTAGIVGGIVGSNRGLLQNCRFEGSVAAKSSAGGIVGVNEEGGYIIGCTSRGVVVGENMTGGIVGYNMGIVERSENHACVNIYTPDSSLDLSDIDLSILMDPTSLSAGITVMDTGGIAGYSIGAVYDCTNSASIGYPHIGYNVGGIVGRSSGTISGCSNAAEIQGRKDVGGICGQMEPNVSLNLSEDHLKLLETQLGELKDLTRQLQGTFSQLGPVNTHLNTALGHVDGASSSLEELSGYITDYTTDLTDEVNRTSELMMLVTLEMLSVLESAMELSDSLASAMETLATAMDGFAETMDYMELSISMLNRATVELKEAGASASQAVERITQGLRDLTGSLQADDPEQMQLAIDKIQSGLTQFSQAMTQAGDAAQKIADIMKQEGTWNDDTAAAFGTLTQSLADMSGALQNMADGLSQISGNISFSEATFWSGVDSIGKSMDSINDAMTSLQAASDNLSLALVALEKTAELGGDALRVLSDAMEEFATSFSLLTEVGKSLETAITRISKFEPIRLPSMDEGATDSADRLFMSINGISDALGSILSISDQFSQEAKQQLDAISLKFEEVVSTALRLVDQIKEDASSGLISDTSDVNIDAVKAGKVSACVNTGAICGDINVGGITGAMAIEYQLDPEDDISAELSDWQTRTYQAKAIVQDCANLGAVSGKRNYMGGICGQMDMGIILGSSSFGAVSSSEGDFVGGIAGDAAGVIRQCSVKSILSGGKYVGGVAGQGVRVEDCLAMTQLSGGEKTGSILGYAEEIADICRNLYYPIPDSPGAIDGISYDGCAQAAQPDAFLTQECADPRFGMVELTFRYEDGVTQTLTLPAGAVLEETMVPSLENTAQQILSWAGMDDCLGKPQYFDRVFAVERKSMVTVLESAETRPNGMAVVLLQGTFLSSEKVQLEPLAQIPEMLEGWGFTVPQGGTVTQIRYACPEEEDLQILALSADGSYKPVPVTRVGSYLVFSLEQGNTQFYVARAAQQNDLLWLAVIAALVAGGIAVVAVVWRGKAKRSVSRKKRGTTEG